MRIGILYLVMLLSSCNLSRVEHEEVVFWIDDQPVVLDEFHHWMGLMRTDAYNYFYRGGNLVNSYFKWDKKYEAITPAEYLKKITFEKLTQIKVQQIEAKKMGVISSICYHKWMEDMYRENQLRMDRIHQGKPVYGAPEFNARAYFDHKLDQMVYALKVKLTLQEMTSSHSDTIDLSPFEVMQLKDQLYPYWVDSLVEKACIRFNDDVFNGIVVK